MKKLIMPLCIVLCLLLVILLQTGFIFLMLALLPAIVAYYVDTLPGKAAFQTVFSCNLAAALPFFLPLAQLGLRFKHNDITELMNKPHVWLIIYGGAAVGWCLIYMCRFIARIYMLAHYDYKITNLEQFQKKLVEEWGEEVKQSAPA